MFHQFRSNYPQGSLISELVTVEYGRYVVRALARVEGVTLATSLASGDTVEAAEDKARSRLIAFLGVGDTPLPLREPLSTPPVVEAPPSISEALPTPPAVETPLPVPELVVEEALPVPEPVIEEPIAEPEPIVEEPIAEPEPVIEEPIAEPEDEAPLPIPVSETPPKSRSKKARSREPEIVTTPEPDSPPVPETPNPSIAIPEEITDVMIQTGLEIKRLKWTTDQGREYLVATYGKRSRQLLTDEELVEFLTYLKTQPSPD